MFFGFGFVWFRVVFVFAMVHHIINTGHTLPPLTHKIGSRKIPGGGGGNSTNFCTGRLGPKFQPITSLYTIFCEKGTPFLYLLLKNGTLSHTLFRILNPF